MLAFLHRDGQAIKAEHAIARLIRDLLAEAAETGDVRTDVAFGELSRYCLHALTAAGSMPSKAAVDRLVAVTMDRLGAPPGMHITRLRPGPRPAASPVGYSPSCFTYAADFG